MKRTPKANTSFAFVMIAPRTQFSALYQVFQLFVITRDAFGGIIMAEVMSFRLNKEHRRKLLKLANAWNCSQTDVIRRLIERAKLDVIRNGTKNEGDSDVKRTSTDRAKLIAELQQLHAEAEKKRRRGQL